MTRRFWIVLALVTLPQVAWGARGDKGNVLDRAALARVESYCVDLASLADDEALVVKGFLREQSKPKGLFKDLRWKRLESCQDSGADATIKLQLPLFVNPQPGPRRGERDRLKGILRVYDNSTSGIIYTAEALPLESAEDDPAMVGTNLYQRCLDALRRVFSMLIHDLKTLPPRPAHGPVE